MWSCHKGAHLITGAIMLNGVACGMIYLPLQPTTHKLDIGAPASDRLRQPVGDRSALEQKQHVRSASISSLSHDGTGTAITKDTCFDRVKVSDSVSRSMHAVNDDFTSLTEVGTQDFGVLENL